MRRVNDALIFYLFLVNQVVTTILDTGLEKYSRGRRGAPAKGVGRETGARVQIPPSPSFRFFKKVVDKLKDMSYSKQAVAERHSKNMNIDN